MYSARQGRLSRLVALVIVLGLALGAMPVSSFAAEKPLDRSTVIKRAKVWTKQRVPYSQTGKKSGYRRDCSGFVSMAWDLPENLVTWNLPLVSRRIAKKDLKPGDIILNASGRGGGRHVVIFERWANRKHTKYVALEQTGQNGVNSAVRRVVKYPYRIGGKNYKPYRYVGMNRYYKKVGGHLLQPVRRYRGRVETPAQVKARKAAFAKAKVQKAARIEAARKARAKAEAAKKAAAAVEAARKQAAEKAEKAESTKRAETKDDPLGVLLKALGILPNDRGAGAAKSAG